MDSGAACLQGDIFNDLTSAGFPARYTFARNPIVDSISRALAAAGASVVDEVEFRMFGEDGVLETPLAATSYEVWELPERRITTVRSHKWRAAARLGPVGPLWRN